MKQKTVKSAKKRIIKITSTGKIMRRPLSGQHLVAGKTKRTMAKATKKTAIVSADVRKLKRMVPNG